MSTTARRSSPHDICFCFSIATFAFPLRVLRWLSLKEIPALEAATVVSGGMLPKLNACKDALLHGVKRVRILPAESATLLPDLINSRVNDGTEVIAA